ncbi:MAG: tol-pal system protein YbgF [Betaproteobacteria bacterium]|jgi:tol-pal system protein YbgF|nr:tol-pal system protein YbgF [Betaproteobacteria bacterium]NBP44631.1 tol-pal system protein YbgF [Betaproteobacteria bacterium]
MRATRPLLLSLALGLALPAQAGLFEDEEARKALMELQQQLQTLKDGLRQINDDAALSKRSYLDLQSQNENLLKQIAELRGSLEQLTKQLSDLQRTYKDLNKQLEDRFVAVESRVIKLEPVKVTVDGVDFMAEPPEKRDYELALDAFRKGDFAGASGSFRRFIEQYPRSGYLPSALFWSGNSLYATRKYKEAVQDFKQITEQFASHSRVAESLLSMANCQIELKDVKTARKTLEALIKQFPGTDTASAAQERLSKLR